MTRLDEIRKRLNDLIASDPAVVVSLLAFLCGSAAFGYVISSGQEDSAILKESDLKEFNRLGQEYQEKRMSLERFEKRFFAPQYKATVGELIAEINEQIGLGGASFKSLEDVAEKGNLKQGVEVKYDGITLNQTVNLVYKIENHENILLIKDVLLSPRFDNQNLFDMTMTVLLVVRQHE